MAILPDITFTGVRIVHNNLVYVSAVIDELAEEKIDHTIILRYLNGEWGADGIQFSSCGMWPLDSDSTGLISIGIDGNVVELNFPGEKYEHIDESDEGPSRLVHLKAVKKIGENIYVAGMARHVYYRNKEKFWVSMDREVYVPNVKITSPCGFLAIDGNHENEIYAVGLGGEIWCYDGHWVKEESPTSVTLTRITTTSKKEMCIVGLAGVVIYGRKGRWDIIDQTITKKNFWGCANFGDMIYLSNYNGVYILKDDRSNIDQIKLGFSEDFTTAYLDSRDGVMWSVGHKDIAFTTDGVTWTALEAKGVEVNYLK